ncbi:MAG: SURF1 family cytochrome oxidase biogenesis protein [Candidatus Nanopelagicus sp.]|jgi:surfeit locus 1 family protein
MKKLVKQFLFVITWLLLIYTGFELGVWQLNKAQNLSASTAPVADQPVIELSKIASAGLNIPIKAVNRIVSASGNYSNKYIARDQKLVDEKIVDLDVRLLDLDTGYSILVVRGKANEPLPEIKSKTQIVGRLYPRQNVDRAFPKPGELSRIDPALVVSEQTPFLYDGYIVLKSEKLTPQLDAAFSPIPSPQISQRITTFYWQHISYVVVWWFMAVLLLIAPLFPQFRKPKIEKADKKK